MCTVNILEGLRFYVSFACSFAFGELKLLEGSARLFLLLQEMKVNTLQCHKQLLITGMTVMMTKIWLRLEKNVKKKYIKCMMTH